MHTGLLGASSSARRPSACPCARPCPAVPLWEVSVKHSVQNCACRVLGMCRSMQWCVHDGARGRSARAPARAGMYAHGLLSTVPDAGCPWSRRTRLALWREPEGASPPSGAAARATNLTSHLVLMFTKVFLRGRRCAKNSTVYRYSTVLYTVGSYSCTT